MDPSIESDWLGCKKDPIEIPENNTGNITRSWQWRERGIDPPNYASNKTVLENVAEDILVQKSLKIRCCELPGSPRSTFLMVFSPDGTKVASTHGNHNVYVSELASGKHVRVLQGHPRTPWCVAFHPSHTQLIGSGCLGGQVRVWDISSGGSEVWYVPNHTVISSIAFHPRVQLLVVATYNDLYFWDWSKSAPFTKVSTNNINEKVRYVAFDALGYKLITGISSRNTTSSSIPPLFEQTPPTRSPQLFTFRHARREEPDENPNPNGQEYPIPGTTQDVIVNSYHSLVQRYDSLVRSYQRLFMFRHRMSVTPPPPTTTDRGTDPMESDPLPETSSVARAPRGEASSQTMDCELPEINIFTQTESSDPTTGTQQPRATATARGVTADRVIFPRTLRGETSNQSSSTNNTTDYPTPGTTCRHVNNDNETDGSNSRLLNLDVLSLDNNSQTNQNLSHQHSTFGSRPSAFQPLHESTDRTFRTVDQNERPPNPFSSTTGSNLSFSSLTSQQNSENASNSSRTSIFPGLRTDSLINLSPRRRRLIPLRLQMSFRNRQRNGSHFRNARISSNFSENTNSSDSANEGGTYSFMSGYSRYSAFDLLTAPEDSQSINESLDLIRDILRDSGSRLVDLITRVSLSTLVGVGTEENVPTHSDDSDMDEIQNPPRRDLSSTSSDSDSDHSLEVNILRTPNATFREEDESNEESPEQLEHFDVINTSRRLSRPDRLNTDVLDVDVSDAYPRENATENGGSSNVSSDSSPLHVHFNSNTTDTHAGSSASDNRNNGNSLTSDSRHNNRSNGDNSSSGGRNNVGNATDSRNNTDSLPSGSRNNVGNSSGNSRNNGEGSPSGSRNNGRNTSGDNRNIAGSSSGGSRYNTSNSSSESRRTSETQPSYNSGFNPNRPSTSRENIWSRERGTLSEEVFGKVRAGVIALHKHTVQLTDIWLQGNTISVRELRTMWDNLRRRIIMIHRENGRPETLSHYTRSLLERCRTLNEMTEVASRTAGRNPRNAEERSRPAGEEASVSNERTPNDRDDRRSQTRSPLRRSPRVRSPFRRRLQPITGSLYRWRRDDEIRRRSRIVASSRLSSRSRRDYERAIELAATRHEVRMRAMQVLSVMFNSMMMCLEERGLGQVIKAMLRLLKKALALSCLMIMTIRDTVLDRDAQYPPIRIDSLNAIRIQTVDHAGPVNVEGLEDSPSGSTTNDDNADGSPQDNDDRMACDHLISSLYDQPSTSHRPVSPANQRWSNRLAVQIAAANRNTSTTARNRRDLYIESRKLKALHRTNPIAHPLIKKRILPPVTTHRIPALRLPNFNKYAFARAQRARHNESGPAPAGDPATNEHPRLSPFRVPPDVVDEFEQRISLIRRAHMQAVRLRNAARSRFRRLQTIRLYTPSSIREMFSVHNLMNPEDQREFSPPPQNEPEQSNPRRGNSGTIDFRPGSSTRDRPSQRPPSDEAQFHTVFNNVAMPLMHVNDLPTNEVEGPQPQRPPRIHEYLQPIILAQNAMVMDEDGPVEGEAERGGGGGGGAGGGGQRRMNSIANLLDAGIISEAFPAPSHRIQAWDFTTGDTPDISNSTKNIVVAKCRIHNDASIDISKDGRILVALHPLPRLRTNNHWLGVYSLEWARLGQCLHTAALEQSAVSVALSPTARHLAVGLGSRRFSAGPHAPHARSVFALLYRLEPAENSNQTGLTPVQELKQNWEQHGFRSLNCLRWAPQPGQGFVYANNTGQLLIMS